MAFRKIILSKNLADLGCLGNIKYDVKCREYIHSVHSLGIGYNQ